MHLYQLQNFTGTYHHWILTSTINGQRVKGGMILGARVSLQDCEHGWHSTSSRCLTTCVHLVESGKTPMNSRVPPHLAQAYESTLDYFTVDSITYVNITVLRSAVLAREFEVTCNRSNYIQWSLLAQTHLLILTIMHCYWSNKTEKMIIANDPCYCEQTCFHWSA